MDAYRYPHGLEHTGVEEGRRGRPTGHAVFNFKALSKLHRVLHHIENVFGQDLLGHTLLAQSKVIVRVQYET